MIGGSQMDWKQGLVLTLCLSFTGPTIAENIITGQVTFSGGNPPPITEISISADGSCGGQSALLNGYGQYELRNITSQQRCWITVSHGGTSLAGIGIPLTGYRTHANLLLRSWQNNQWAITRE